MKRIIDVKALKNKSVLTAKTAGYRVLIVLKWIGIGILVGAACGLLGALFDITVDKAVEIREEFKFAIYFAPVAGLVIVGIYTLLKVRGQNTNTIITAVHTNDEKLSIRLFPAIFLGTAITQIVGGSAGREGAALQMGGTIGNFFSRGLRLKGNDIAIAILSGMAAYFAAIFGTPVTAAVFVITIIQVGVSIFDAFIPCMVSSLTAYWVAKLLGVKATHFDIAMPDFSIVLVLKCILLAVAATVIAVIFYKTIHGAGHFFSKLIPNPWIRTVVGGCLIIAFTLLFPSRTCNGIGMNIIRIAIEQGQANTFDWLLKIVLTAITLGTLFKGGEVVPSFFVGATFGCVFGKLIGMDPGFAAAIGLVCVFCAATNSVLASIILSVEVFGAGGLPYFAIACALSFILSGNSSLYSAQKVEELKSTFELSSAKNDINA